MPVNLHSLSIREVSQTVAHLVELYFKQLQIPIKIRYHFVNVLNIYNIYLYYNLIQTHLNFVQTVLNRVFS